MGSRVLINAGWYEATANSATAAQRLAEQEAKQAALGGEQFEELQQASFDL